MNVWGKLLDLDGAYKDEGFLRTFKRPPLFIRDSFFFLATVIFRLLFKADIRGIEHLPEGGPYIVAANHSSALDYPVVAWSMPKPARDELYAVTTSYFYDNPFTRFFIMIATNSIRVDTQDDYGPALKTAAKVLAQGGSVYINPEGTWSEDGALMAFKPGVGLLSYMLKVPIVPVYLGGTFDILPAKAIFPRKRGSVKVYFGKPIYPDNYLSVDPGYDVFKRIADDVRGEIVRLRDKKDSV